MLIFNFSLILAMQTPVPATPVQPPRFGVIVGKSPRPILQPNFDRLVNYVASQFGNRFSVTPAPIPRENSQYPGNPANCKSLNLVGFLIPSRRWQLSSSTVFTAVGLMIFDCDGNQFFNEWAGLTEKRKDAMIPQAQMDSIAVRETRALLAKFANFESGHPVLWSRILATGSLRPNFSVSPSAIENPATR